MKRNILGTLSVLAIAAMISGNAAVIAKASADNGSDSIETQLQTLERELSQNGTDVVSELNDLIANLSLNIEGGDANQQSLLETAQEALDDYLSYISGVQTYSIIGNAVYKAAVSAAVAYFNSNDYILSAELLLHARDNQTLDSVYEPTNGYLVTYSEVFQSIANGTKVSGSAAFPNSGDTVDKDLYYSIHAFSYTKPAEDSTTVVISDRYDFAEEDNISSVVDLAVDIMYKAQQAGVITPFLVSITQSL